MEILEKFKEKVKDLVVELCKLRNEIIDKLNVYDIVLVEYILNYEITRASMDWKIRKIYAKEIEFNEYRINIDSLLKIVETYKEECESKSAFDFLTDKDIDIILTIVLFYLEDLKHFSCFREAKDAASDLGSWPV